MFSHEMIGLAPPNALIDWFLMQYDKQLTTAPFKKKLKVKILKAPTFTELIAQRN